MGRSKFLKEISQIKLIRVKNPNWPEESQLAFYKGGQGFELGTTVNKSSYRSGQDLNSGPPNGKSSALTTATLHHCKQWSELYRCWLWALLFMRHTGDFGSVKCGYTWLSCQSASFFHGRRANSAEDKNNNVLGWCIGFSGIVPSLRSKFVQ